MQSPKQVPIAFVMHSQMGSNLQLCAGILEFMQARKGWILHRLPQDISTLKRRFGTARSFAGVIGRMGTDELISTAASVGFPVVNIHGGYPVGDVPMVGEDDRAIGRLAADYFLHKGFLHFGYIGFSRHPSSDRRFDAYRREIEDRGLTEGPVFYHFGDIIREPDTYIPSIRKKAPQAMFVYDDNCVLHCMQLFRLYGIRIPEDLAVLSVNNDEQQCMSIYPNISSIRIPYKAIGYRAARELDHLMKGRPPPRKPVLFPPDGVEERASTDTYAVTHPVILQSMHYIRSRISEKITLADLARHAGVSVRSLNYIFKQHTRKTPGQLLTDMRVEETRRLLSDTDLTMEAIAEIAGFSSMSYLSAVFKKHTGHRPAAWRRMSRAEGFSC